MKYYLYNDGIKVYLIKALSKSYLLCNPNTSQKEWTLIRRKLDIGFHIKSMTELTEDEFLLECI